MSFNKRTNMSLKVDDVEIMDGDLIKTAAIKLPEGYTYDPDYLYLKVKAVSAGEYWGDNKNNDYFPEAELIANYKTFLSAHTFKNHDNKKVEGAIGDVLDAEWNDKMKSVYLVIRIDRRIAPSIVRGFEKGFMTDVSMGCRVNHVICSYCGKKAKTKFDYCDHLKYMKGKIMDNGKKVCEINIGPKFHDISAVLNGAERSAKAVWIMIGGEKVAASIEEGGMQKVASFDMFDFSNDIFSNASDVSSNAAMEILASAMTKEKKQTPKDVDNFKDKLKNKITSNALDDLTKQSLDTFDGISKIIKLNYTNYWDKNKCESIGRQLKELADLQGISRERLFCQFLKVADFAAIELSPLEIHDIYCEVMNIDTLDYRSIPFNGDCNIQEKIDPINCSLATEQNLPTVLKTVNAIHSLVDSDGDAFIERIKENPAAKIKMVIIKSKPVSNEIRLEDYVNSDIMEGVVSKLLEERSNHRKFLIPRLIKISDGEMQPHNNAVHFSTPLFAKMKKLDHPSAVLPAILSTMINSAYQKEREKRANSDELNDGIMKFASYFGADDYMFDKTASIGGNAKAIMVGVPLTMSYSALQRSRMNNGERINSFNRYIAENPTNAAFLYAMGVAPSAHLINKGKYKTEKAIRQTSRLAKDLAKSSKNIISKRAGEDEDSIFKNASIDDEMIKNGYSNQDLNTIKQASILTGIEKQDYAENLLNENDLTYEDVDQYLKIASSCFKIEFEKNASNFIKNIGGSVLGDVIFDGTKNKSLAASVPGYLADGLIIAGIGKGLEKASKKAKQGGKQYV